MAFGVAVSVFVVDPPALPTTQDNDHHQPGPPDRPHPVARRPDCTNKSFLSFFPEVEGSELAALEPYSPATVSTGLGRT